MYTYISLFSSAGIGCYGFKEAGFECVATNELVERRLAIQKSNNKCKYPSGYICGDITLESTKQQLEDEVELWKRNEKLDRIDVIIATPPCQGMSVANHKKSDIEIVRNSLVVESISIIKKYRPRFFVFENVPAFMKTLCTDLDGTNKAISEAIDRNLGSDYSYASRVINFKNYGASSSRQRTLVIGVANDIADEVSPYELFPELVEERTLREVIGDLPELTELGEIDESDIYHFFRPYPEYMRTWIHDLKEGMSAFDNTEDSKKPHQIINGEIVINQRKNGDKYTRNYWDKVGPCVHTRNDQLASQNTIHPKDDRVFSIRELMRMMTIPSSFKWSDDNLDCLNSLSIDEKRTYLKKNEINIRQSIGEAVPTAIFSSIAIAIRDCLDHPPLKKSEVPKIIEKYQCTTPANLMDFIDSNPLNLSLAGLSKIAEMANVNRTESAAFYTSKSLITEIIKMLPDIDQDEIHILEPSCGVGNFVPLLIKKYEGKKLIIDLVDIDPISIQIARKLIDRSPVPSTCSINYITDDFLLHDFTYRYDIVVGNPPFGKLTGNAKLLKTYKQQAINKATSNICSFFLDKAISLAAHIALVFPKFILNTPEFSKSREYLSQKCVNGIIDFGENGFPGVLIETIALFVDIAKKPGTTHVRSITERIEINQSQKYIFDKKLPYWIIYRNDLFDTVFSKMTFDVFSVFRDRQITNKDLHSEAGVNRIRVLKSRNISDDGTAILDINGYDAFIDLDTAKNCTVFKFIDEPNVYISPNMTYYPRVMEKPTNTLVNGSVAILIPKTLFTPSKRQLLYFSSEEFRLFYRIARNYQTRSLNIDSCSVFFFGLLE